MREESDVSGVGVGEGLGVGKGEEAHGALGGGGCPAEGCSSMFVRGRFVTRQLDRVKRLRSGEAGLVRVGKEGRGKGGRKGEGPEMTLLSEVLQKRAWMSGWKAGRWSSGPRWCDTRRGRDERGWEERRSGRQRPGIGGRWP